MPTKIESRFEKIMEGDGWEVCLHGFPDSICKKDGKIVLVEVKGNQNERLRDSQIRTMNLLKDIIPCFVWDRQRKAIIPVQEYLNKPIPAKVSAMENKRQILEMENQLIHIMRFRGETLHTIAESLGMSVKTVKQRYALHGRKYSSKGASGVSSNSPSHGRIGREYENKTP